MKTHKANGLKRLALALQWSSSGLKKAFINEAAFRQEVLLALLLCPLGIWLGKNGTEKSLLAGSILLILIIELLNSSIEAAVDRMGEEIHPLAGQAKDMGSAAVLLTLLLAALIWVCILFW